MGPILLTLEFPAKAREFLAAFAARNDPPLRAGAASLRPQPEAPAFAPPLPCAPEELAPELVALLSRATRWTAADTAARLAPLYAAHNGLVAALRRPVPRLAAAYPWPDVEPGSPAFAALASLLALWLRELQAYAPEAALLLVAKDATHWRLDPPASAVRPPRRGAPALADFVSAPQAPEGPWLIRAFVASDRSRLAYYFPRFRLSEPPPPAWVACSAADPSRWHALLALDGATLCFPPPVAGAAPDALAALIAAAREASPASTDLFHPEALPFADPRAAALRAAGFATDRTVELFSIDLARALSLVQARLHDHGPSVSPLTPADHSALGAFVAGENILAPAQLGPDPEAPAYHLAYSFAVREAGGAPRTVLLVRAPEDLADLHLLYLSSRAATPQARARDSFAVLSSTLGAALRDGWRHAWFTTDTARGNLRGWLHPDCCQPRGTRSSHRLARASSG